VKRMLRLPTRNLVYVRASEIAAVIANGCDVTVYLRNGTIHAKATLATEAEAAEWAVAAAEAADKAK
jgi:hypothetical protein